MSSPPPVSRPPPPSNSRPPPGPSITPPPPPPGRSSTPPPPPGPSSTPPPPPPGPSNTPPPRPPPPDSGSSPPLPPDASPPSSPPQPSPSQPSPAPAPINPSPSPAPKPSPPPPPPSPPPPPPINPPPPFPPVLPPSPIPVVSPPPPPIVSSPPPPPFVLPPPPAPVVSPPPPTPVLSPPPPTPVVSPPPPPPASPPPSPLRLSPPPPPATPSASIPPPPPLLNQSPPPPPSKSSSSSIAVIAGSAAAAAVAIALLLAIYFIFCRKRRRRSPTPPPSLYTDDPHGPYYTHSSAKVTTSSGSTPPPTARREYGPHYSGPDSPLSASPGIFLNFAKTSFTYEELEVATDGFSEANLLGRGGFGHVYKGTFDGKEFAVKKLTFGSGQGDREFLAEVEKLSRVHHKHLVSLIGYCISGSQRMLVYEYLPNNTLDFHLHGKGQPTLEWSIRFKIAMGAAKGLAYLHEDCRPKIIHRDIKAANILLDSDFEAKVSDFGLAKFQVEGDTHISTRVMGTFGYLAPEYAVSGKLTDKSDVFSIGVMMLELITGRRPVFTNQSYMDETLVGWARPLLTEAAKDGNYEALVDPRLENNYDPNEMLRLVACAAACVRQSAKLRPRMSEVVRFLQGELSLDVLHGEVLPGYSALQSSASQEHMNRLRRMAFANQDDMTSSIYSVPSTSSEFNRNLDSSSFDNDPYDRDITDSNKSTAEFSSRV